jgi:hypothetical protein
VPASDPILKRARPSVVSNEQHLVNCKDYKMNSSILDKIRQLRTLSQSSNINEATAAAAAADRLISKHRISEAEISIANNVANLSAKEAEFVLYETARVTAWKQSLAMNLAHHYGCAMWIDLKYPNNRKVSNFRLVGVEDDMEICRYMFSWLTSEIERLSKTNCAGMGHVFSQSYCSGAVSGIRSQLDLLKQEEKVSAQQAGQTTALACLDERINKAKEAMYSLHKNLKRVKTHSNRQYDANAYNLGVNVGKSIHLGKVMNSSSENKMLG